MATARNGGAAAPGASAPTSDEAPAGRTAQGFKGQAHQVSLECRAHRASRQARRTIKRLIVLAACWGFPAAWAQWLIDRARLTHE